MRLRPAYSAFTTLLVLAVAISSCSPAPISDPFDDSGELLALSGGDAGPQAACHTCHGLNGEGDGAMVPRIAGLDPGYMVSQLGHYADGQRSHPQMSWLAARLNSEERLAVATYYALMRPPAVADVDPSYSSARCALDQAHAIYQRGLPERGLAPCASCHGTDGEGIGTGIPSLTGQGAAYHAEQLRRWRSGERYGDPMGVMHDAASKLREDEIIPLAEYIAGGPAPSRRPESRAICP
ncbi:cytochrome c [Alteriqipengyuania sp.]|uniref:c-type cytochrome n=1 Tax=Alteriqipengyuania sp. TaxID=2800692 RepID=UPI003510FC8D